MSAAPVALVPPGVVTVISTMPPEPEGDVAVIEVALTTVTLVALLAPNFTPVAPVKFVPVMVTAVPPALDPPFGDTAVTAGTGGLMVSDAIPLLVVKFAAPLYAAVTV